MSTSVTRKTSHLLVLASVLLAVAFGYFSVAGPAQAGGVINTAYSGEKQVAISGYDPVAYFTEGKPVEGSEAFVYDWLGATWHFASAEHRDLFATDPYKYSPQYGGYCAAGMSGGEFDDIDPQAWAIVDGKLYLNYSVGTHARWLANRAEWVVSADAHWERLNASLTK